MKLITDVAINIKKDHIHDFVNGLYQKNFLINSLNLINEGVPWSSYQIEIMYSDKKEFNSFIDNIKKEEEKYAITRLIDVLEERTVGGLLNVSGKHELSDINTYQTDLLGSIDLIFEKIVEGNGMKHSGISRNIALVSGILNEEDTKIDYVLQNYALAEKESVIINRFTGLNAYPVVIQFDHGEDFIKTLQRIELTYSAIKLLHVDNADISLYDQIYSDVNVPILSEGLDDVPLYILTMIMKLMTKNRLKPKEVTVGFIGLDISVMRLTRILLKQDYYRVLGCDGNEKHSLSFENQGGLATTQDNIFFNADIVVILKKTFDAEDLNKLRPGAFVISLLHDEDVDLFKIHERGVRDFIHADKSDVTTLSPGVVHGLVESGIKHIDDINLINIAKKLLEIVPDDNTFPDIFGDIHKSIADYIKKM